MELVSWAVLGVVREGWDVERGGTREESGEDDELHSCGLVVWLVWFWFLRGLMM